MDLATILRLLKAFVDLAEALNTNRPDDFNNVDATEAWLAETNRPAAELIALMTPDTLDRVRGIAAKATGRPLEEIDWKALIDWIAEILKMFLPDQAWVIDIIAQVLKQLLDLLLAGAKANPGPTAVLVVAALAKKVRENQP